MLILLDTVGTSNSHEFTFTATDKPLHGSLGQCRLKLGRQRGEWPSWDWPEGGASPVLPALCRPASPLREPEGICYGSGSLFLSVWFPPSELGLSPVPALSQCVHVPPTKQRDAAMETSWWTLSGVECCFEWVGERRPRGPHHTHTCVHPWGRAEPLSPPQPHRHRWPFNYVGKEASGPHAWSRHRLLTKFVLKPDQAMRRPPCVNLVSLRRPDWKPPRLPGHEAVLPPL